MDTKNRADKVVAMAILNYIDEVAERDPSWQHAYGLVKKGLDIPTHVSRLFRGGWAGEANAEEYFKIVGFARLNPRCLLDAANISRADAESGTKAMQQALFQLGVRFSAVVLAINFTSKRILSSRPPVGWKSLFQDMMTSIEIGYKFGTKASSVGLEAGSLIGFAPYASQALLMTHQYKDYIKFMALCREKKNVSQQEEAAIFGCERYQVAAALLQQLGFGTAISLGTSFGMIQSKNIGKSQDEEVLNWQAASSWITALKLGRNYPADPELRNFFPEVKPSTGKERNLNLEVLYTEISKVRSDSSEWLWHLPLSSYDETKEALRLP